MKLARSQPGFEPSWFLPHPPHETPASRLSAPRHIERPRTSLMGARVFIAVVLLVLQGFIYFQGTPKLWPLLLGLGYLVATVAALLWLPDHDPPLRSPYWIGILGLDLAVFGILQWFQQGGINFTPLFILPVLLAAMLGPLMLALGSAAAAALILLGEAWWNSRFDPGLTTARALQSALTGTGLFMVALLANQLALRLAREQALAQRSQQAARNQAEVNELIVKGLNEGVLVADGLGNIWHANPAACAMLDATRPDPQPHDLQFTPAWPLLKEWIARCLRDGEAKEQEFVVPQAPGMLRKLYLRAHPTQPQEDQDRLCVVFLEDLREIEARVRIEKLAAMGRMSVAVAHEIRNPLSAIVQANALLDEDTENPGHKRLIGMIRQNTQRLARTVDDILNLNRAEEIPGAADSIPPIDLDPSVRSMVQEWLQQKPQHSRLVLDLGAPATKVRFEAEHLRRVLINLLDNAERHASQQPGAIRIQTRWPQDSHTPNLTELLVWSDGTPLESSVQQHLFEPFFSSSSRSTGLGLYICRELCERYGALIDYRRLSLDGQDGNAFLVQFAYRPQRAPTAIPSPAPPPHRP